MRGHLYLSALAAFLSAEISAHVVLVEPPSRNYLNTSNTCKQCMNGDGGPNVKSRSNGSNWPNFHVEGSHGICGDPGQGLPWQDFADQTHIQSGTPQREYVAGDILELVVAATAHHMGHYEVRICDTAINPTNFQTQLDVQSCLDANVIERAQIGPECDGDTVSPNCAPIDVNNPGRWYLPQRGAGVIKADINWLDRWGINAPGAPDVHIMKYQLPYDLTCAHCTLQFYYATSNSCVPHADYMQYFAVLATANFPASTWNRWAATNENTQLCTNRPEIYPEEFWNCADITITGGLSEGSRIEDCAWISREWGQCTTLCGEGFRTRDVQCICGGESANSRYCRAQPEPSYKEICLDSTGCPDPSLCTLTEYGMCSGRLYTEQFPNEVNCCQENLPCEEFANGLYGQCPGTRDETDVLKAELSLEGTDGFDLCQEYFHLTETIAGWSGLSQNEVVVTLPRACPPVTTTTTTTTTTPYREETYPVGPNPVTPAPVTTAPVYDPSKSKEADGLGYHEECKYCNVCVAIVDNYQAAPDSACAFCAAGGKNAWPCLTPGLCECAAAEKSKVPEKVLPVPTGEGFNENCKHCSVCVAIPGNALAVNDFACAKCAAQGVDIWPCVTDDVCQCSPDEVTIAITDAPVVDFRECDSAFATLVSAETILEMHAFFSLSYSGYYGLDAAKKLRSDISCGIAVNPTFFNTFANKGSREENLRDVAAFLAHVQKESNGFLRMEEILYTPGQYCDATNQEIDVNATPKQPCEVCDGTCEPLPNTPHFGIDLDTCGRCLNVNSWWPCGLVDACTCVRAEAVATVIDYSAEGYTCNPAKSYHGRGAIQMQWSSNYGKFSEIYFNGDKTVLLEDPDLLVPEAPIGWAATLWFYLTEHSYGGSCPPTVNDSCTESGASTMHSEIHAEGKGFAKTISIINGGSECCISSSRRRDTIDRIEYFLDYCVHLGGGTYEECFSAVGTEDCPLVTETGCEPVCAYSSDQITMKHHECEDACIALPPANGACAASRRIESKDFLNSPRISNANERKLQGDGSPCSDCGDFPCVANFDNVEGQTITDAQCADCTNAQWVWWPCATGSTLCMCGDGSARPQPTPAPSAEYCPVTSEAPELNHSEGSDGTNGPCATSINNNGPCSNNDKIIVGYFASWGIYGRKYYPSYIPAAKLTHVLYAFSSLSSDCVFAFDDPYGDLQMTSFYNTDSVTEGPIGKTCLTFYPFVGAPKQTGTLAAMRQVKSWFPHLTIQLSLGGWTKSTHFSTCARTSTGRQTMARTAVTIAEQNGFHGLDVDWEFPTGKGMSSNSVHVNDWDYYVLLLDAIRSQYVTVLGEIEGNSRPLSIAAGQNPEVLANAGTENLRLMCERLDHVYLMSYDYFGPWNGFSGHIAPLYNTGHSKHISGFDVNYGVQKWLEYCDASKIVLGIETVGRIWKNIPEGVSGTGEWEENIPGEASCGTFETGVLDFWQIKNYFETHTSFSKYWSTYGNVPFLYSAITKQFISYEDELSVVRKVEYANGLGLGGIMLWDLSGDREEILIDEVARTLGCKWVTDAGETPAVPARSYELPNYELSVPASTSATTPSTVTGVVPSIPDGADDNYVPPVTIRPVIQPKKPSTTPSVPEEHDWFVGDWWECTTTCGGGVQVREVSCPPFAKCVERLKPSQFRECSVTRCFIPLVTSIRIELQPRSTVHSNTIKARLADPEHLGTLIEALVGTSKSLTESERDVTASFAVTDVKMAKIGTGLNARAEAVSETGSTTLSTKNNNKDTVVNGAGSATTILAIVLATICSAFIH